MPESKDENELRKRKSQGISEGRQYDRQEGSEQEPTDPKYGPMPTFPNQRVWTRIVLILGTLVVVYFTSTPPQTTLLAKQKDVFEYRRQNVPCSNKYLTDVASLPDSCKLDQCGISVRDRAVKEESADALLRLVQRVLQQEDGGGAVSGPYFINLQALNSSRILDREETMELSSVRRTIKETVGPPEAELDPTEPSFFSRISSDAPQPPPDKCKLCHFNAILYLNDFNFDFEGGRTVFVQPDNTTVVVEPRKGRLVSWWGGGRWAVEAVRSGASYSLRLSFSCTAFEPPQRSS